jgi:hypothetical protein
MSDIRNNPIIQIIHQLTRIADAIESIERRT